MSAVKVNKLGVRPGLGRHHFRKIAERGFGDGHNSYTHSMTWFNGRVGYSGEMDSGSTWNVGLNVQNIFDREPPFFGWTNNTYDQYGRRYNISFNYSY